MEFRVFKRGGGLFVERPSLFGDRKAIQSRRDVYYHSPGNPHGVKLRGEGSGAEKLECKLLVLKKKRGCEDYRKKRCHTLAEVAEICGKAGGGAHFDSERATAVTVEKVVHKAWLRANEIPRMGCEGGEGQGRDPRPAAGPPVTFERSMLNVDGVAWQTVCIEAAAAKDVYAGVQAFFGLASDDWQLSDLPEDVIIGGYPSLLEVHSHAPSTGQDEGRLP